MDTYEYTMPTWAELKKYGDQLGSYQWIQKPEYENIREKTKVLVNDIDLWNIVYPDSKLYSYKLKQKLNQDILINKELLETFKNVLSHLIAAHSLLSRGGKKAAMSDTVFDMMMSDYAASIEKGRTLWNKIEEDVA